MKALALLLIPGLAIGANASVSGGRTGGLPASPAAPPMQSTSTGQGGGSTGMQQIDPRQVPPLDPKREVTKQDCTHPVDLTKGNLKCK